MKKWLFLLLFCPLLNAQASRPVSVTWTASTSSSVTGYSVFRCTVPAGQTSCTPSVTGAPLKTVTGTSFSDSAPIGAAYGYSVVANAPACSPTSSLSVPCGTSGPATLGYIPVPPQTDGAHNTVIVVP